MANIQISMLKGDKSLFLGLSGNLETNCFVRAFYMPIVLGLGVCLDTRWYADICNMIFSPNLLRIKMWFFFIKQTSWQPISFNHVKILL